MEQIRAALRRNKLKKFVALILAKHFSDLFTKWRANDNGTD